VDVSDPSSPTETGVYVLPDIGEDFCVADGFAYVADWSSLQVLDVRGGGPAMLLGRYGMLGDARAVAVTSDTAVVSNMNAGLRLFDVVNPRTPAHLGSTAVRAVSPRNVTIDGDLAYLAGQSDGVFIFDITDPPSPVLQAAYDPGGSAEEIRIAGGMAYVADGYDLLILDVADPTSPAHVARFPVPGWASGIDLANEIAYVADFTSGLLAIDVADPTSPVLRSHYPTPGEDARDVSVHFPLAYLAAGSDGLLIFDVSDPSSPALRGAYDTPGLAWGICVDDAKAYIADVFSVVVVDVADPTAPFLCARFETPGGPESVCAADGLIYVADYDGGLWILNPANLAGTRAGWNAYF
jgi:hypothetical protein